MNFSKKLLTVLFLGTMIASGCGPGGGVVVTNGDAYFDMNNDTYDNVDVYVDGFYQDTVLAGETHRYDLGIPAVYNIQISKQGDLNSVLNNTDVFMDAGVTSWDVYTNAPVATIINDTFLGNNEALDIQVDGANVQFAIESNGSVAFDSTLLVDETGFYLLDEGSHTIDITGNSTSAFYTTDTRTYVDGTHVTFKAQ